MHKKKRLFIGTSGWYYEHWESFYEDIPKSERLHFYATHFPTVEINSTFYHLPKEKSVQGWVEQTPKNFVFSVKASRYLTHIKRLKDPQESIGKFIDSIDPLESKLGPILFQVPPYFKLDHERLIHFVEELPKKHRYVFEFRHDTWYTNEVYKLLKENDIALCITDLHGKLSPVEATASFIYVRLHGPKQAYRGRYSSQQLSAWAKRIRKWTEQKLDVYVYFDNDEKGYAVKDALKLTELC